MRTHELSDILPFIKPYLPKLQGMYPEEWIGQDRNIALLDDGDLALFEEESPGIYYGHYFFVSRGRAARVKGNRFLDELFTNHGAEIVKGLTPVENLGAKWMSRQLGFKSFGVVTPENIPCELFILSKRDHLGKEKK